MTDTNKRLHGQFFTTTNPFVNEAFVRWLKHLNQKWNTPVVVEPFAGCNNIPWMIREMGFKNDWRSYDIQPPDDNATEDISIEQRDTLADFPPGFKVAISNPPYLAKNSAVARGLDYAGSPFADLYQKAIAVMLDHVEYAAVIIPETFIKQNLFHSRLQAVVSLNCQMFDDTSHPVCLALFVPETEKQERDDFSIWRGNQYIGTYLNLETHLKAPSTRWAWRFNDPAGSIGLKGYDSTKGADIEFIPGDVIPSSSIKHSSRHNTRISLENLEPNDIPKLLLEANKLLKARRKVTHDVFMTAHRGLREDGKYRRRLDFEQARDLLDLAYEKIANASKAKK